jgi:hypothetical protein
LAHRWLEDSCNLLENRFHQLRVRVVAFGWAACVAFSFLVLCDLRESFLNGRSGRYDTFQDDRCLEDPSKVLENRFCRDDRLAFGAA